MKKRRGGYLGDITPAEKALSSMKYRDLQRECIIRGMDFKEMVSSDFHQLQVWFIDNYDNGCDNSLLNLFDVWFEQSIREEKKAKGIPEKDYEYLFDKSMRLGFYPDSESNRVEVEKFKKKPKVEVEKKEKRERDAELGNIYKGTKKEYTFRLVKKGYSEKKVIRLVLKKFSEAKEKSIKIWYKKALKLLK